ncbi:MAG: C4-dicarboxylate transporter DcuC [Eubacteriales bacterium]
MELIQVLSTLLIIVLLIIGISKKFYTATTMLLVAIATLIVYTLVTGNSVMEVEAASGSKIIDVFEFVKTRFLSTFASNGIIMLPVFGYSIYMNNIGASKLFALVGSQPVKNSKNPYLVGIPVGIILAALVRLAIPSHTGVSTLLLTTLFPILVNAGLSRITAASVVLMGSSFDWGPADAVTSVLLTNSEGLGVGINLSDYAINYQFKVFPIAILVTIIVLVITSNHFDKKDGFTREEIETAKPKDIGLPMYYCVLPLLPLIFMIIFSKFIISSITISAFAASFLSFIVAIILEGINKKDFRTAVNDSKKQFEGMGKCYTDILSTISAASVFAGAITVIGGFDILAKWLQAASVNAVLILIVVIIMVILMTAITTSSTGALQALVPFIYKVSVTSGQTTQWFLSPLMFATGLGRSISPISPAPLVCAGQANVDVVSLTKRCYIPFIAGQLVITIISLLMY